MLHALSHKLLKIVRLQHVNAWVSKADCLKLVALSH